MRCGNASERQLIENTKRATPTADEGRFLPGMLPACRWSGDNALLGGVAILLFFASFSTIIYINLQQKWQKTALELILCWQNGTICSLKSWRRCCAF